LPKRKKPFPWKGPFVARSSNLGDYLSPKLLLTTRPVISNKVRAELVCVLENPVNDRVDPEIVAGLLRFYPLMLLDLSSLKLQKLFHVH